MRGLFVTGTDTGVGKTVLSAALLAAMTAAGERVSAHKPAVTGLDEHEQADGSAKSWPADHELLAAAARMPADQVAPLRYGPAVSPLLAAELAGETLQARRVLAAGAAAVADREDADGTVIVEGVGGLLSPLAENLTVCDFAVALRLPLLVAARPGLGTINHTLLTLQCARAAGLSVRAVVLTPWPEQPSRLERSNLQTIARFGSVEVDTLARVSAPQMDELARAGAELPWRRWLGERPGVTAAS
jgi:dethiobiotin synthetase